MIHQIQLELRFADQLVIVFHQEQLFDHNQDFHLHLICTKGEVELQKIFDEKLTSHHLILQPNFHIELSYIQDANLVQILFLIISFLILGLDHHCGCTTV